jgi:hypothetical protein
MMQQKIPVPYSFPRGENAAIAVIFKGGDRKSEHFKTYAIGFCGAHPCHSTMACG